MKNRGRQEAATPHRRSNRTGPGGTLRVGVVLGLTVALMLILALPLWSAGCGEEAGRSDDVVTVLMDGLQFTPSEVTIEPGVTVRWVNQDETSHTSTAEGWEEGADQPLLWDSTPLNPGESFERTFDSVGIYDYFCMVHPYMTGEITVTEEGGPEPTDVFVPSEEAPDEEHE